MAARQADRGDRRRRARCSTASSPRVPRRRSDLIDAFLAGAADAGVARARRPSARAHRGQRQRRRACLEPSDRARARGGARRADHRDQRQSGRAAIRRRDVGDARAHFGDGSRRLRRRRSRSLAGLGSTVVVVADDGARVVRAGAVPSRRCVTCSARSHLQRNPENDEARWRLSTPFVDSATIPPWSAI